MFDMAARRTSWISYSAERVARLISSFSGLAGWVGGMCPIDGRQADNLDFAFLQNGLTNLDFIFLWHSGVCSGTCPNNFRRDSILNMAARQTYWISYSGPTEKKGRPIDFGFELQSDLELFFTEI
jgi:hypothetical protein